MKFKGEIIDSHKLQKFKKIDPDQVFDFLPLIQTFSDREILESWKKHFVKLDVPFFVTIDSANIMRLYKEKYTD